MNRDDTPGADGTGADPRRAGPPTRREVRWTFRRADKYRDHPGSDDAPSAAGSSHPGEPREHPSADTAARAGDAGAGHGTDGPGPGSHRPDGAPDAGAGGPGPLAAAQEARAQEPGAKDPLAAPVPEARPAPEHAAPVTPGPAGASATERWREIQSGFVDDPPRAVRDADELVAAEVEALAARLAERRRGLRGRWDGDRPADTELLRTTLREYRALLESVTAAGRPDRR